MKGYDMNEQLQIRYACFQSLTLQHQNYTTSNLRKETQQVTLLGKPPALMRTLRDWAHTESLADPRCLKPA